MTDDLVVFLRRMLDDEEEAALVAAEQVGDSHWEQHDARIVTKADYDREVAHYGIYEYIEHIVRWDPERVLADVDAKRRIVALHTPIPDPSPPFRDVEGFLCSICTNGSKLYDQDRGILFTDLTVFPCLTLRLLAAAYRDRPGYRPEWAPDA